MIFSKSSARPPCVSTHSLACSLCVGDWLYVACNKCMGVKRADPKGGALNHAWVPTENTRGNVSVSV